MAHIRADLAAIIRAGETLYDPATSPFIVLQGKVDPAPSIARININDVKEARKLTSVTGQPMIITVNISAADYSPGDLFVLSALFQSGWVLPRRYFAQAGDPVSAIAMANAIATAINRDQDAPFTAAAAGGAASASITLTGRSTHEGFYVKAGPHAAVVLTQEAIPSFGRAADLLDEGIPSTFVTLPSYSCLELYVALPGFAPSGTVGVGTGSTAFGTYRAYEQRQMMLIRLYYDPADAAIDGNVNNIISAVRS